MPPGDFKSFLNPHSLEVLTAKCEPGLGEAKPELRYQFERLGYFALDDSSTAQKPVFNRTVALRVSLGQGKAEGMMGCRFPVLNLNPNLNRMNHCLDHEKPGD